MPLLKTLLFTLVVPGTVAIFLPCWVARRALAHFDTLGLLGLGLCALGAAIYLRCAWDFATRGRGTPAPIDPPKELVVSGPYRYVRNPMYVGVLSLVLGQAAFFRSAAVLEYGLVVLVAFHLFVVAYEEPSLRARFGPSYERYCAAVGRWLPRLRPWNGGPRRSA